MFASEIIKTLYAPHKAFKEVIQNPRYLGPLVIILLFVAANTGFTYAAISKTYVEQLLPDGSNFDVWTDNSTYWKSNAEISESNDFINGTYYGNHSIAFSANSSTYMWADLENIGSVDCSSLNGYPKLSFRIKWVNFEEKPANFTIYMFSESPSNYFYHDLNEKLANSSNGIWNNLTLSLVSDGWVSSGSNADWGNITSLKLNFEWTESTNVTLFVDGLFFHGTFKSLLEGAGTAYLTNYALLAVMQFVITWVFLSGIAYIMSKSLGGQLVWKPLLVLVGFALITMPVQAAVNTLAYSSLSTVKYPFELIGGVEGEVNAAYEVIAKQTEFVSIIGRITQVAVYIWTIILCSIAIRLLAGLSWIKSVLIGVVAYMITILAMGFILGM